MAICGRATKGELHFVVVSTHVVVVVVAAAVVAVVVVGHSAPFVSGQVTYFLWLSVNPHPNSW